MSVLAGDALTEDALKGFRAVVFARGWADDLIRCVRAHLCVCVCVCV